MIKLKKLALEHKPKILLLLEEVLIQELLILKNLEKLLTVLKHI